MIWMEHASQRFLLRPTRIREDNQMMEPPLWDIWKIIDQTAAACSASFSLLSNEVLQRTRNSLRTGTSVTKKPPTTISRASSSDFMAPTNKDGLGRVMSNLKISEQVQGLKGSSDSHWDAFHQEQQSLHVPGEHLSSRGLRQTDSIQTSATSSECGEDNFTLYQGFAVPQRRPPSLDKGDSDATLPRQVSIAAIDDPLQLHSDSRKHKDSIKTISKIYKDLLRQRDLALEESQALDEQRTALEKDLGKVRDRLKKMYEKERELSMRLHEIREQEETVHANLNYLEYRLQYMGEETSVLELKAKSSNSDSQIILASPRGSPVRSGSPRKALRTVFCDDSSDAYQPQFKHPSMEGWKSWQAHPTCVKRFNIDQSHNRLVTLSSQGPMRVWDASNFKLLAELISPNDCPLSNAMQYAENICMVGTQSGDLLEWDLSVIQNSDAEESPRLFPDRSIHRLAPKCKYEGHIGNVTGLQFDNSVLISGSADGTVRIWDRESRLPLSVLGQTVSQPLHPTSSGISTSGNTAVQSLYFYHHALASGYDNGVVRLWDTRTGYCHRKLSSSESCVRHLSFDKNYLVTGSADGLVEFWDLRQDAVVESVAFHQPILSLSLDRGRVVVGTTSQIGIFSLQEPLPTAYPVWALTDLSFSDGQLFFSDTSGQMHQRRIL